MKIAIYTRKSVYTDNSESIHAQYNMCYEYCRSNFSDYTIIKFEDEGFTGANTKRPSYSEMIEQVNMNMIDIIVCYKIDRISRSVLDFSKFFNLIEQKGIKFVSVTERIDTSTPSGRAMMYMSSVFGQMERESIAERIKDTMIDMANTGYWCGGQAPIGYMRSKCEVNAKLHTILEIDEDNIYFYKMLVDLFINKNLSLNGIVTHLRHNNITKSPTGGLLTGNVVYQIISNPVYVQADETTYNYFKDKGCTITVDKSKFDGKKALMRYGRTISNKGKKHQIKQMVDWNISVGLHDYIITSDIYMKIVSKFGVNKINKVRKHEIGIVHGILKCKCGSTMRAKYKYDKQYDVTYKNYFCKKREMYGKDVCDMPSLDLDTIDNAILDILKNISLDKDLIESYTDKPSIMHVSLQSVENIKKDIVKTENKITNLTRNLSLSSTANKYLILEIENLDAKLNSLKVELNKIEYKNHLAVDNTKNNNNKYNQICDLVNNFESLDYKDIQNVLRSLLKECSFDGETLHIKI